MQVLLHTVCLCVCLSLCASACVFFACASVILSLVFGNVRVLVGRVAKEERNGEEQ